MFNDEISKEIRKGRWRGKSFEELKPLYLERNAFNVSLNATIYRIFQLPFLMDDIANSRISLTRIDPTALKDPLENPFLNKEFREENGELTRLGMLDHYYGASWTLEENENPYWWGLYTYGNKGARVQVKAGRLMDRITSLENPFFFLEYFITEVFYEDEEDIR